MAGASLALCSVDQFRCALAEAESVEEVLSLQRKAEAVRKYARSAALGLDAQNEAAEAKLLAERKAGDILADIVRHGGMRRPGLHEVGTLADLGVKPNDSSRWQLEAWVPPEIYDQYVRDTKKKRKELTSAGLRRIAHRLREQLSRKSGPFEGVRHAVRLLGKQQKIFACIYADLPWNGDRGLNCPVGHSELMRSLIGIPLEDVVDASGHIFLWVPAERISDAIRLIKAWGFRYETVLLAWTKTPATSRAYLGADCQLLLLGTRGDLPFRNDRLSDWQPESQANRTRIARQLIERVSKGPYLDLFGCAPSAGWTAVGDER